MFGSKKRKPTAPPPVSSDVEEAPLDPAWVAEQEAAEEAAARSTELGIGDEEFARAVWLAQLDEALKEPLGGSASRRIAHILSHGAASGLTKGQLAALRRLAVGVDAARAALGAAARRRASGRLKVVPGGGGRNF